MFFTVSYHHYYNAAGQPKASPKPAQNLFKSQIMLNNNYKNSSPCDLYEMTGSMYSNKQLLQNLEITQ